MDLLIMLLHTEEYTILNVRAVRVTPLHSSQHGLRFRRGGLYGDGEDWGLLETHSQRLPHCIQTVTGQGLGLNLHLHTRTIIVLYEHF